MSLLLSIKELRYKIKIHAFCPDVRHKQIHVIPYKSKLV